jgi:hypothetical protein
MIDDADMQQIRDQIDLSLANWDSKRRERFRVENVEREAANPPVTRFYLISLGGNHVAFPDELGRAIFTQAVYARVTRREDDWHFTAGKVEVVAYGDGQRLKKPINMILTGLSIVGMAEVSEDLLK